jgi:hypothetical protein
MQHNGGDEERRRRAREAKTGGHIERVRVLADRMRSGELSRLRVELAAAFGDPTAVEVTGQEPSDIAQGFDAVLRPFPRVVPDEYNVMRWTSDMKKVSSRLTDMPNLASCVACCVAIKEFLLMDRNGLDYRHHREEMADISSCFECARRIVAKLLDEKPLDKKDRRDLEACRRRVAAIRDRYDSYARVEDYDEVRRPDEGMEDMPEVADNVASLIDLVLDPVSSLSSIPWEYGSGIISAAIDVVTLGDRPQEGEIRERVSDPLIAGIIKELIGPKLRRDSLA